LSVRATLDIEVVGSSSSSELLRVIADATGCCFIERNTDVTQPTLSFIAPEQGTDTRRSAAARLDLTCPQRPHGQRETVVERVTFAEHSAVPWPFRGRSLATSMPAGTSGLDLEPSETVLASCATGPIWTHRFNGNESIFRCCLALPAASGESGFADVFSGDQFLSLLPLISFLRETRGDAAYRHPAPRASFIIDDPNLHWPTYGFVNYRELARQAEKENYHLAFATIPLDAWFTHRATADLFRSHPARLSLLVHGNNHSKAELARTYSPSARRALLGQALKRVERLER